METKNMAKQVTKSRGCYMDGKNVIPNLGITMSFHDVRKVNVSGWSLLSDESLNAESSKIDIITENGVISVTCFRRK